MLNNDSHRKHQESTESDEIILNKAEKFNEFFADVGRKTFEKTQEELGNSNIQLQNINENGVNENELVSFKPSPVNCDTVILAVKSIRESNACGSDGISLRFIKDSLYVIAFYLTVIVNTSVATNTYPDLWKISHVVPTYKSGDEDNVSNYRPISLLPVMSKILEKIIAEQLSRYLEFNNLLSNAQHGFRPKLSTETALLKISDKIYNNMDNKKISLLLLLDLSKAFDSVNHEILLRKCQILNIETEWFESYLRNRQQIVKIKNITSSCRSISFGVPQGSILGPILFIIFVNDLIKHVPHCYLVQYADDTQILLEGDIDNLEELIQRAVNILDLAKTYFQKNGLLLNTKKTQCISSGLDSTLIVYMII